MKSLTITTGRIRDAWQRIQDGRNPVPKQDQLRRHVEGDWTGDKFDRWIGMSPATMNERLIHGYVPESKPDVDVSMGESEIPTPALDLNEEGCLVLDAALAGEELYRVMYEEKPCKKALTMRANIAFNCGTSAEGIISKYLDWLLAVMDAAQTQGIPADLELTIKTIDSYPGVKNCEIRIPVVKAGEMLDAAAWRAFLSPGSFRSLGFLAMGLAGEDQGLALRPGLGRAAGQDWAVDFDAESGVLEFDCPPSPGYREFPLDKMNEKVQAAFDAC